jgi:hypothetical protein
MVGLVTKINMTFNLFAAHFMAFVDPSLTRLENYLFELGPTTIVEVMGV